MRERRIYRRSPIELAASYGIPEDLPVTREAKVVNVSSGGFGFFCDRPIKTGEELLVAIDLENGENTTIKVRTVWAQPVSEDNRYIVGVQIMETRGPDFERFLKFYNAHVKLRSQKIAS